MAEAIELVCHFFEEWAKGPDALIAAFEKWFTPQTVWENIGYKTTTGIDEANAFNRSFIAQMGPDRIEVEILAIAENGNKVLTERVDRFVDPQGNELIGQRIMGIFEICDGKIIAWREYFNPSTTTGSLASQV